MSPTHSSVTECRAGVGRRTVRADAPAAKVSTPTSPATQTSGRKLSGRTRAIIVDHITGRGACLGGGPPAVIVWEVDGPLGMIEFPADDPDRARRFWSGLLGIELAERTQGEGRGWQTQSGAPVLGVHQRGAGPGDTAALPYFSVADMQAALDRVRALGGNVIHPGAQWAICRDSEGSPFGLALDSRRRSDAGLQGAQ